MSAGAHRDGFRTRRALSVLAAASILALSGCFASANADHAREFPPSSAFYDLIVAQGPYHESFISVPEENDRGVILEGVLQAGEFGGATVNVFFDRTTARTEAVQLTGLDPVLESGSVIRAEGVVMRRGPALTMAVRDSWVIHDSARVNEAVLEVDKNWSGASHRFLEDFGATDRDFVEPRSPLWDATRGELLVHHDVGAWTGQGNDGYPAYEAWVHVWYRVAPESKDYRILALLVPP